MRLTCFCYYLLYLSYRGCVLTVSHRTRFTVSAESPKRPSTRRRSSVTSDRMYSQSNESIVTGEIHSTHCNPARLSVFCSILSTIVTRYSRTRRIPRRGRKINVVERVLSSGCSIYRSSCGDDRTHAAMSADVARNCRRTARYDGRRASAAPRSTPTVPTRS